MKSSLKQKRKDLEKVLKKEGKIAGIKEGKIAGIKEGKIAGSLEQMLVMTKRVMASLGKTIDEAMAILELNEDEKQYVRRSITT